MNSWALSSSARIIITLLQTSARPPSFRALHCLAAPAHGCQLGGAASEQGGRTRRGGKACPLLGPIQSGPGLSLLRTGPRGPASWPPGSRPASPFPPPSGHTGLFLLLWHAAAFSLDSRKSGSFLSFGAPLKHHLGEVLSGHSPLLAHPFVIYPEATNSPRPMRH